MLRQPSRVVLMICLAGLAANLWDHLPGGALSLEPQPDQAPALTAKVLAPPPPFEASRDPFQGGEDLAPSRRKVEVAEPVLPDLNVEGIMYTSGGFRGAVINGRVWVEGQSGPITPGGPEIHVRRITDWSVEITTPEGLTVLRLPPPMERHGRALAAPVPVPAPFAATPRMWEVEP